MRNKRVVITGIGPVCQLGIGKKAFIHGLLHPTNNYIKRIPEHYRKIHNLSTKFYVPATHFNYKQNNGMNFLSQNNSAIASLAAELAIKDAKLPIPRDNNISTILGISIGDFSGSFSNYKMYLSKNRTDKLFAPKSMPNAPAAWIAINNNLHGDNYVINSACASGTNAIGKAYRKISNGYCNAAICGGSEWLKDTDFTILKSFEELGVLDSSSDGRPRPFQLNRSGFLFNEGSACCLTLENYESAKKRHAHIYAEITGYEASMDAFSVLAIDKKGTTIIHMLKNLIGNKHIDYYNAHGTGTKLNDKVEANTIQNVFGNKSNQPLINSTKGLLGHTFGASGALEAAICAIAIRYGIIHGNITNNPIPNLNLVNKLQTNTNINTAVSASFGFGGHNGSLLFEEAK